MIKHVFVTALSVFPAKSQEDGVTRMTENQYIFDDLSLDENDEGRIYRYFGHYQLEPIPIFIRDKLKENITDFVLLETPKTRSREKDGRENVIPAPDKSSAPMWPGENSAGTAAEWYREWLGVQFPDAIIHELEIDEHTPIDSLQQTMGKIRELYRQTDSPEEWRLWFDTHGGFRDFSAVLATASRMFALEEENIPTDAVFSVYYSQTKEEPSEIVNLTPFYFTESTEALKIYLNYGQYLTLQYKPYAGSGPYAFISYRHDRNHIVSVRLILAKLAECGVDYWFDDGISTGDNWRKTLEEKNRNAAAFIALVSASYFESAECWKELIRAIASAKQGQKELFLVIMENLSIPTAPSKNPAFDDVRALMRELQVDEKDVGEFLKPHIHTTMGDKYMPWNEKRHINQRNLNDPELTADFQRISRAIKARMDV